MPTLEHDDRDDAAVGTGNAGAGAGAGAGAYGHLAPLLVEFAAPGSERSLRADLREELLIGYLPVVQHIARRYGGRGEPLADLEQLAAIGLLSALEPFEPERGITPVGFDTHNDTHIAAALDPAGRLLGHRQFPTSPAGYTALLAWLRTFGRWCWSGSRAPAPTVPASLCICAVHMSATPRACPDIRAT